MNDEKRQLKKDIVFFYSLNIMVLIFGVIILCTLAALLIKFLVSFFMGY